MTMKLTEHFTLEEMTESQTASALGIENTPTDEHLARLKALCKDILEPIRELWGSPIVINSGYRSAALNAAIPNASSKSQHCKGEAVDIRPLNGDKLGLFRLIKASGLDFDQLINEYPNKDGVPSWIHVSYTTSRKNRRQVLVLVQR